MALSKVISKHNFKPDPKFTGQSEQVHQLIRASQKVVAFTGAGVSAESGIPTYRGAGGMWTKYDPAKYASIEYFRRDPSNYWRFFKDLRHDLIASAKPNVTHFALAELEDEGILSAVITQNIDGLHQQAGSKRVLELHGNTRRFCCVDCAAEYDLQQAWDMVLLELPPHCKHCKGILRPDVVLFGEMLPQQVVEEAEAEAAKCDLMLVIGSSLVVYPAAYLPQSAKMNGAKIVIINIDPTPLDDLADIRVAGKASDILYQST